MVVPAFFQTTLPAGLAVALCTSAEARDGRALSPDERRRVPTFRHADRRAGFVLGRTAARTLLAERLGGTPSDAPLTVGADGAPTVSGLHVSIAHAGRGAGVTASAAVAPFAVGVDLEPIVERRPDLWRRILAPAEHALLEAMGGPTARSQTLLWSLKEAVLKGQRTGLRAGARSVVLTLDAVPRGAVSDTGTGRAVSEQSGAWRLAWARADGLWLCVAWADGAALDGAGRRLTRGG